MGREDGCQRCWAAVTLQKKKKEKKTPAEHTTNHNGGHINIPGQSKERGEEMVKRRGNKAQRAGKGSAGDARKEGRVGRERRRRNAPACIRSFRSAAAVCGERTELAERKGNDCSLSAKASVQIAAQTETDAEKGRERERETSSGGHAHKWCECAGGDRGERA